MNAGKQLYRRIVALMWPERCIFCGEPISALTLCCDACRAEVTPIRPPICPQCGKSREDCACGGHRHRYDRVASPFYCSAAVHRGIVRLKRWDDPLAVGFFAEQMEAVVRREFRNETIDAVTFIPMTARDRRNRGYNQGELLARALAKRLSLPLVAALEKCYQTKSQKFLSAVERSGNVLGAFDVRRNVEVDGKTWLLVDDVITTGATVDECAKMLKLYGARRVLCVTASVRRRGESEDEPV